ncbi:MAG TPA: O-methyltransferase [Polyangia bacterium]|nr:O-methyltransferase [Polyangia bacterium]
MNKQFGNDDERLAGYVRRTYAPEDDVLREIRERCTREGLPDIQVAALDARHLEVLAAVAGARKAVEIGTLGGYSGVSLLRGMGIGGVLDTIEVDPRHAEVARESFRRAGYMTQARIHLGSAMDVLPKLAPQGPFDLVFIDADKDSYPDYLNWAADNLRPGGLVIADNVFLFGELADKPTGVRATSIAAMQAFHQILADSGRFRATVLPTGEGLAVGVRV